MTTMFVVRPNGAIEEMALEDLAALIGRRVVTPRGFRLRWQAACVDGQWGVVDARFPHRLCLRAEDEEAALLTAAAWNIMSGTIHDLSRLGIHTFTETLEEAEAEARDLKEWGCHDE